MDGAHIVWHNVGFEPVKAEIIKGDRDQLFQGFFGIAHAPAVMIEFVTEHAAFKTAHADV